MKVFNKEEIKIRIAKNVAAMIDADSQYYVINLGVGIPSMVSDYLTRNDVFVMAENGILGVGPVAHGSDIHPDLANAARQPILETPGCCYFNSAESFAMIRSGRVDATVIGAFEVDRAGDVANWIIPGGNKLGVGGAMDLVTGARKVFVAMAHTNKGIPKLVEKCALPITAKERVNYVVTEYGVFEFGHGVVKLIKIASGVTVEEVQQITGFPFTWESNVDIMID